MSCIIENRQLPQVKNTEAQLSIKIIRFCSDIIKVNVLSLYYWNKCFVVVLVLLE